MRVKLQYEVNLMDGTTPKKSYTETDFDDPVFLNMQFCIEREQYKKLLQACQENKVTIQEALNDLLTDPNPYTILDQYGP